MKVIYGLGPTKYNFSYPVIAIGIFDGVHKGHQELIKKLIVCAKKRHGQAIVLTFHPHPVHVLHPEIYLPFITSLPYRLKLLEELGVDVCIVAKFDKKFSRIQPETFIKEYLVKRIKVREVFVGDDFRFGVGRSGDRDYFQQMAARYNFIFHAVNPIKAHQGKVSSTDIRKFIEEGDLSQASKYLGRPVAILGKVLKGDRRGTRLGFPTANIYNSDEILPPRGVYAVKVKLAKKLYKGMANVGFCPSFHQSSRRMHVEVHLFRFNKDLYGQEILVQFIQKIRDEKIFSSLPELVEQLKKDQHISQKILNKR